MRRIKRGWVFLGGTFLSVVTILGLILESWKVVPPPLVVISLGQPVGETAMVVDDGAHRAYVSSTVAGTDGKHGNHSWISVIDTLQRVPVRRIAMGRGIPVLALDPVHRRLIMSDTTGPDVGLIRLVNAANGVVLRSASVPVAPGAIAIDGRVARIFVAGMGRCSAFRRAVARACRSGFGVIDVLDARTLRPTGSIAVGPAPRHIVADDVDGRVFVSADNGVTMIDAARGRALHTFPWAIGVMAVDARVRHVFMEDNTWSVRILDAHTGRVVGAVPGMYLNIRGPSAAAAVDERTGNLVMMDNGRLDGSATASTVRVIDGRSGRLLHTLTLGAPPEAVAVDSATGQAFVVQVDDSNVRVLDMRSGRVTRTIPAVPEPVSLALDRRLGRLLVASVVAREGERLDPWGWVPAALRPWLPFVPRPPATLSWRPSAGSVGVVDVARS